MDAVNQDPYEVYAALYAKYLELTGLELEHNSVALAEDLAQVCRDLADSVPAGHLRDQWNGCARAYELY